jgi:hypothetical protein
MQAMAGQIRLTPLACTFPFPLVQILTLTLNAALLLWCPVVLALLLEELTLL